MRYKNYPTDLLNYLFGTGYECSLESLDKALDTLQKRERTALLLRFKEGKTLKETGMEFGLQSERARQIIEKAARKLRHPSRARIILNKEDEETDIMVYDVELKKVITGTVKIKVKTKEKDLGNAKERLEQMLDSGFIDPVFDNEEAEISIVSMQPEVKNNPYGLTDEQMKEVAEAYNKSLQEQPAIRIIRF